MPSRGPDLTASDAGDEHVSLRRRFRRLQRRVRRARRRIRYHRHYPVARRILGWGFGLALGLSIAWLVVTGLLARQAVNKLQGRLTEVRTLVAEGKVDQARAVAKDIPTLAHRAHIVTTGPVWWTAAQIPYLGGPVEVLRGTVAAADQVGSDAVPKLIDVADLINPAQLRVNGDTIRTAPLVKAAGPLRQALREMDRAEATASDVPRGTWLSAVDNRNAALLAELKVIRGYVRAAVRAADVLPTLLGQHGTQRYFIGLQSEAEMRGTGGLPGAFAIATTHDGTITFERFESNAALLPPGHDHTIRTGLDFGPAYDALYGPARPTTSFVNSNVSPNFPYAAQIWATMWEKTSGEHIDDVIAVDPTVLGYFLVATGPVNLPKGGTVSAANVVSLTQRDQYSLFLDNRKRKAFEVSILKAVSQHLTSGAGTAFDLLNAASRSAREQRLLVWSSDRAVENRLKETPYAGALPTGSRPFSGFVVNNTAAGKLDYYLQRSLTYSRTGCGSTRDVIVTMTLTNHAPAAGLPAYVSSRLDRPPASAKPGDNHVLLDYYATRGAQLQSMTRNGDLSTASVNTVDGLQVFRLDVELPRGQTQTIVLHLTEPDGKGRLRVWKQPGVLPFATRVSDQACP